jgi:hypothetical protein
LAALSGEGGIRTLGGVAATPVFETQLHSAEDSDLPSTSGDGSWGFVRPFAQIDLNPPLDYPDLARILDAWPTLPAPIKAALLAVVATAR